MIRFTCGLLVRFLCTTAGAIGARPSLRPSFPGRVKLNVNLGRIAPRECGRLSARCLKFESVRLLPSPLVGEGGAKRRMRGLYPRRQTLTRPRRCASRPPSPTRGEGKKQIAPLHRQYLDDPASCILALVRAGAASNRVADQGQRRQRRLKESAGLRG